MHEVTANFGESVRRHSASSRLETREGAYELKYLVPDAQVPEVLAWAREHLPADPHTAQAQDETYWIQSVYLDTDDLAVYHRQLGYGSSKFRLRRYGEEAAIYLEEKRKSRGWISKARTRIPEAELPLLEARTVPPAWAGAWFRAALEERQLVPCCQVAYRRLAREGTTEVGPVRLTLDREIRCSCATGLRPARELERAVAIPGTLLELKFRNALPALFRELVHTFQLSPATASKYRRATEACVVSRDS